jgi:hypothetical protein
MWSLSKYSLETPVRRHPHLNRHVPHRWCWLHRGLGTTLQRELFYVSRQYVPGAMAGGSHELLLSWSSVRSTMRLRVRLSTLAPGALAHGSHLSGQSRSSWSEGQGTTPLSQLFSSVRLLESLQSSLLDMFKQLELYWLNNQTGIGLLVAYNSSSPSRRSSHQGLLSQSWLSSSNVVNAMPSPVRSNTLAPGVPQPLDLSRYCSSFSWQSSVSKYVVGPSSVGWFGPSRHLLYQGCASLSQSSWSNDRIGTVSKVRSRTSQAGEEYLQLQQDSPDPLCRCWFHRLVGIGRRFGSRFYQTISPVLRGASNRSLVQHSWSQGQGTTASTGARFSRSRGLGTLHGNLQYVVQKSYHLFNVIADYLKPLLYWETWLGPLALLRHQNKVCTYQLLDLGDVND